MSIALSVFFDYHGFVVYYKQGIPHRDPRDCIKNSTYGKPSALTSDLNKEGCFLQDTLQTSHPLLCSTQRGKYIFRVPQEAANSL